MPRKIRELKAKIAREGFDILVMPEVYVFGGCNGSGKTTYATTFFSSLPGVEFVNADIIAANLNSNDVDSVAIKASRLMLERLQVLSARNIDFAFETTQGIALLLYFSKNARETDPKSICFTSG